jgi:hypothetical protein
VEDPAVYWLLRILVCGFSPPCMLVLLKAKYILQ